MSLMADCQPDMIQELQLRRWARRNYVPSGMRGGDWDPVVLDEMRARDAELGFSQVAAGHIATESASVRFVPLAPGGIGAIHPPHEQPSAPNLLSAPLNVFDPSLSVATFL